MFTSINRFHQGNLVQCNLNRNFKKKQKTLRTEDPIEGPINEEYKENPIITDPKENSLN